MFATKMIVDNFSASCCFYHIVASIVMSFEIKHFKPLNIRIAIYHFFVIVGELI